MVLTGKSRMNLETTCFTQLLTMKITKFFNTSPKILRLISLKETTLDRLHLISVYQKKIIMALKFLRNLIKTTLSQLLNIFQTNFPMRRSVSKMPRIRDVKRNLEIKSTKLLKLKILLLKKSKKDLNKRKKRKIKLRMLMMPRKIKRRKIIRQKRLLDNRIKLIKLILKNLKYQRILKYLKCLKNPNNKQLKFSIRQKQNINRLNLKKKIL